VLSTFDMAHNPVSILSLLACPYDGTRVHQKGVGLQCLNGHSFPLVQNVPVLLREDVLDTIGIASESLRLARLHTQGQNDDPLFIDSLAISDDARRQVRAVISEISTNVDPVISHLIGATNGILYRHLVGSLSEYPIPTIPLPTTEGSFLLDIGCSWGRWSIAAARKGYRPVGIDPSLGAILAAKRLSEKLCLPFVGVVGDARHLPFQEATFDTAFSYSVLQHFSKKDACISLREIKRTLQKGGKFKVQMASAWGMRSIQHQALRRFRDPKSFEVRYWSPLELSQTFRDIFGEVEVSVDCYFGLGLQASDLRIMPLPKRAVIYGSEFLKSIAHRFKPLTYLADSLLFEGWNESKLITVPDITKVPRGFMTPRY
jgi:SAM-dependent methyltransferase